MEWFRLFLEHLAWIEHHFLSGIKDSRKTESQWGMMRGVGGVRKWIHQCWLAKGFGLGLGLLCWGFKGVQEEIPSEEASSLQIGSAAFSPGQCTCPQFHPCHRLFSYKALRTCFINMNGNWSVLYWNNTWPAVRSRIEGVSKHKSSSSPLSCRAACTDIPDPLAPLLPIFHCLWLVFWATSCILT